MKAMLAITLVGLSWNCPAAEEAPTSRPTLFIIGDSTVRNGAKGQQGWGEAIVVRFDTNRITIANRAIAGRSSRTFFNEGRWAKVAAELKPGDFVLMQFGHNDGGTPDDPSRPRGSLRGTGEETREIEHPQTKKKETVHTYGWYLRQFVRESKSKGATPMVCSPVPRNIWKEGKVEHSTNTFAKWAGEVARGEGVAFLNLNDLIADRYQELGEEKTKELFFGDHTHTSPEGARLNASVVTECLRALPGNPLRGCLRPEPATP